MVHDKEEVVFYCVPDELGAQSHFWNGESGLLCRPPKGAVAVGRARCSRHRAEAEKKVARSPAGPKSVRSSPRWKSAAIAGGAEGPRRV